MPNRRLELVRQWGALRGQQVFQLHSRQPFDTRQQVWGANEKVENSTCSYLGKEPSADLSTLLDAATWPTLSAQGCQSLPLEMSLFQWCHDNDSWESASGAWKSVFLQAPVVVVDKDGGYVLCCGLVAGLAHVA